jgi:hypothetical protein
MRGGIDEPALRSFDAVTETESLTSRKCSCTLGSPLPAHRKSYDGLPFYRVLLDARATNSSNLESKSFRAGDWFDFL